MENQSLLAGHTCGETLAGLRRFVQICISAGNTDGYACLVMAGNLRHSYMYMWALPLMMTFICTKLVNHSHIYIYFHASLKMLLGANANTVFNC